MEQNLKEMNKLKSKLYLWHSFVYGEQSESPEDIFEDINSRLFIAKNEFGDLYFFIDNLQNVNDGMIKLFFHIENNDSNNPEYYPYEKIPSNEQILEERFYYEPFDYELNDFELYLTKFLVGFYILRQINVEQSKYYFKYILNLLELEKNKHPYYIEYIENTSKDIHANLSYDWRIVINENFKDTKIKKENPITLRQQVFIINFILDHLKVPASIDKTVRARFIHFLIGKVLGDKKIADENTYKFLDKTEKLSDEGRKDLLKLAKDWFTQLGLSELVQKIDNNINS